MNPFPRGCLGAVLLLSAAASTASSHGDEAHGDGAPMQAVFTEETLVLPDIEMVDRRNHREGFVSRYDDAGPVLISFLYTTCEANCTMVLAVMGLVDTATGAPDAPPLRLVVVTVDPVRDTPAVMADKAADVGASSRWDWLAASPADTPALLAAFGLQPGPVEEHEQVYLLGNFHTGRFQRIAGVPDPGALVDLARGLPEAAR